MDDFGGENAGNRRVGKSNAEAPQAFLTDAFPGGPQARRGRRDMKEGAWV